jgi:hypothetical protein
MKRQIQREFERLLHTRLSLRLQATLALAALMLFSLAHVANADTASAATQPTSALSGQEGTVVKVSRDARGRKIQTIDFNDALIEGKVRTPEGFVIQSKQGGRFNSLIELPRNFRERIRLDAQDVSSALEGAAH